MWLYIKGALVFIVFNLELFAQSAFPKSSSGIGSDSLYSNGAKLTKEASYIGDFVGNLSGGNKQGTAYLGMANLKLGFETKNIGLWENGEFLINGASTHGATPSENLFGDFQVASNIEAGNHIYIHELWYRHNFGSTQLTLGLQDLCAEFVTSDFAGNFINSSFGIPSLIAENVPVPIFPLTALGITGKFKISNELEFKTALFDGLPEGFEDNQYNLNWQLNSRNGVLIFSELQLTTDFTNLPGIIKAGGYYHSHLREVNEETGLPETVFKNNYGFYIIADQTFWQKSDNTKLGFFAQVAVSPGSINLHNYYIGGGISCSGISGQQCENSIGLAFAHAGLSDTRLKSETVIELFYRTTVTENLFVQPDFQYIINPAGSGKNLENTIAAFIRFGINF